MAPDTTVENMCYGDFLVRFMFDFLHSRLGQDIHSDPPLEILQLGPFERVLEIGYDKQPDPEMRRRRGCDSCEKCRPDVTELFGGSRIAFTKVRLVGDRAILVRIPVTEKGERHIINLRVCHGTVEAEQDIKDV